MNKRYMIHLEDEENGSLSILSPVPDPPFLSWLRHHYVEGGFNVRQVPHASSEVAAWQVRHECNGNMLELEITVTEVPV